MPCLCKPFPSSPTSSLQTARPAFFYPLSRELVRFVVEVIDQLDLSNLTRKYARRGSKAHHPATLLSILIYDYATGVFSSSASSPPTSTPITTPLSPFTVGFWVSWRACLCRCWRWPKSATRERNPVANHQRHPSQAYAIPTRLTSRTKSRDHGDLGRRL